MVVSLALTGLTARGTDFFTIGQLLAMLVATYSVAAYADRLRAVAGLALVNVAGVLNSMSVEDAPAGDFVYAVILLSGPWLAGRALRAWRERAAELERLTREVARLAAAEERARIARELHDAVAHSVNVVVIQAEAAEELLDRNPERVREPLRAVQRSGREALVEIRAHWACCDRPMTRRRSRHASPTCRRSSSRSAKPGSTCSCRWRARSASWLRASTCRRIASCRRH